MGLPKEINKRYPCVSGITADAKHEGRVSNLVPQTSYVEKRHKALIS